MRSILSSARCISPASVFDPLSARAAEALGHELIMLAGSVASAVVVGAPDLVVLTLTELVEQARRITRVSRLPLLVDADHGFGNALNVVRCVEELEAAGVAALTIEDTDLPRPFASEGERLVSVAEGRGKIEAALAARRRPESVILARTSAVRVEGVESAAERVRAYSEVGADGIFLVGVRFRAEIERLRSVTTLPFVLGTASAELLDRDYLAGQGVRVVLLGHAPFQAAVRAMYETMRAVRDGATASDLADAVASPELITQLTAQQEYDRQTAAYLADHGEPS